MNNYRQVEVLVDGVTIRLCVSYSTVVALYIPNRGKSYIIDQFMVRSVSTSKHLNVFFACDTKGRQSRINSGDIRLTKETDLMKILHESRF